MKHIFVVNPAAGPVSALDEIKTKLEQIGALDNSEIYVTKGQLDAVDFVRRRAAEEPNETLRFYACGGDGTLNEVASGVAECNNAELSCYPCGSGNDYVKCYGGKEAFMDLKALMATEAEPVDLMKVCGRFGINITNFGFDAVVGQTMIDVKRKKIIGGKNAYKYGVFKAILKGRKNKCRVYADGKPLNPAGVMLLCTVANGQYVGGAFKCAPLSINNDGMLDVCLLKPMSLFKFLSLLGAYTAGNHFEDKRFEKYIVYCRAIKVEVKANPDFEVCIDGEMTKSEDFVIEVVHNAIKFAAPKKTQ